jgi:hypothetical protein
MSWWGSGESSSIPGNNYQFMFPLKAGLLYTLLGNVFYITTGDSQEV